MDDFEKFEHFWLILLYSFLGPKTQFDINESKVAVAPGASAILGQFPSRECMCPPYIESPQSHRVLLTARLHPLGPWLQLTVLMRFFLAPENVTAFQQLLKTSIQAQIPHTTRNSGQPWRCLPLCMVSSVRITS